MAFFFAFFFVFLPHFPQDIFVPPLLSCPGKPQTPEINLMDASVPIQATSLSSIALILRCISIDVNAILT